MNKSNLWKVPAYCLLSGFICYQLLVHVLGYFAIVTLPDGSITADRPKLSHSAFRISAAFNSSAEPATRVKPILSSKANARFSSYFFKLNNCLSL